MRGSRGAALAVGALLGVAAAWPAAQDATPSPRTAITSLSVFAGTASGLFRSYDWGNSWHRVNTSAKPVGLDGVGAVFGGLLGRGDSSVVEPMQRWLDSGTAGILAGFMQPMLNQFKQRQELAAGRPAGASATASGEGAARPDAATQQILETLQRLERAVSAMDERVKKIEEKVGKN